MTAGLFDENLTGIRIAGFSGSFLAMGNTITNNVKDGVTIDVAPGIQIRRNVIDDNGASGISTNKAYNLNAMVKENTITNNRTAARNSEV